MTEEIKNDVVKEACGKDGKIIYKDGREEILRLGEPKDARFLYNNDIT